jgi:hypothetical protein
MSEAASLEARKAATQDAVLCPEFSSEMISGLLLELFGHQKRAHFSATLAGGFCVNEEQTDLRANF